jgi:hypothetical protein
MKEKLKLGIYEGVATVSAILVVLFCLLPAYVEKDAFSLSDFQIIFGNERTDANGVLIFALVVVILAILVDLAGTILSFLGKLDDKLSTIFGVTGGVLILLGGILLTCSILITGLDKANSELGLIQGNWSIGIANFLVIIFTLISCGFNYPSAMIILHHKDLLDKPQTKKTEAK